MNISKSRRLEAEAIARRIPATMQRRGLQPAFSDWLLTEDQGLVWLFGVVDDRRVERLEHYVSASLLHHLSTVIGGRSIYLSNSSGLRYAVLLSKPLPLPRRVDFPGRQRGRVLLGVRSGGASVGVPWSRMGHWLVAGKTGAGKSVFLRLLVYQALGEGAQLLLADTDDTTFPMLAGHPALLAPTAHTSQDLTALIERALGECEHRAALFKQVAGFPDNLDEYNLIVAKEGGDPLPRLLVVLDEFNAMVTAAGGARGSLATAVATLGWRGRKFGVNLVFAAQDFTKAIVGRVRDQVSAVVCFRVRGAETARAVGCPAAVRLPELRPGLAVTDRWGLLQAYYLDKSLLLPESQTLACPLTADEQALVNRALEETEGRLSISFLLQWGMTEWQARRLLKEWELRGWVQKNHLRHNARYVTEKMRQMLSSPQTSQTTSSPSNSLKGRRI